MAKHKVGLHKEVASIFDGVPIKKGGAVKQPPQPPHPPAPGGTGYEGHPKRTKGRLATAVSPRAPLPTPLSKTPEPQQPAQPVPEAVPAEQPKVDTATKTTRQIPLQQTWEQIKNKLFNKLLAPKPGVNAGRQKAMAMLVPVLFIVLIFVFIKVLIPPTSRTQGSTQPGPASAVAALDNKIDWQIPEPYPRTLRDPMQFGSVTTVQDGPKTGTLIVTGIVHSMESPSAIIDNQIVRVGDTVSGATVVKINRDSVELEMNGKRWTQRVSIQP